MDGLEFDMDFWRTKKSIYAAKELNQNLKHCKQLRKLYLQAEKGKKCSKKLTKYPFKDTNIICRWH
jgi:hypothetical protein